MNIVVLLAAGGALALWLLLKRGNRVDVYLAELNSAYDAWLAAPEDAQYGAYVNLKATWDAVRAMSGEDLSRDLISIAEKGRLDVRTAGIEAEANAWFSGLPGEVRPVGVTVAEEMPQAPTVPPAGASYEEIEFRVDDLVTLWRAGRMGAGEAEADALALRTLAIDSERAGRITSSQREVLTDTLDDLVWQIAEYKRVFPVA